jgi:hypothetical protein
MTIFGDRSDIFAWERGIGIGPVPTVDGGPNSALEVAILIHRSVQSSVSVVVSPRALLLTIFGDGSYPIYGTGLVPCKS